VAADGPEMTAETPAPDEREELRTLVARLRTNIAGALRPAGRPAAGGRAQAVGPAADVGRAEDVSRAGRGVATGEPAATTRDNETIGPPR
jgi:hypothetical protein